MKTRFLSSRRSRSFGALAATALCASLALSLLAGSAAAGGDKCAAGAEAAGCKLPVGARFYKKLSGSAAITVQVNPKGVSLTAYAAPIKCTKFAPLLGNTAYLAVGISATQHPKVGKSYGLEETETQRGEEGEEPSTTTTEATLQFKSAQLVVVKIHQVSETGGQIGCDGGASWNVKRQE